MGSIDFHTSCHFLQRDSTSKLDACDISQFCNLFSKFLIVDSCCTDVPEADQ